VVGGVRSLSRVEADSTTGEQSAGGTFSFLSAGEFKPKGLREDRMGPASGGEMGLILDSKGPRRTNDLVR